MTNKIKILIGDDSAQYGVSCASALRAMGFFVITRPKDGLTIFDAIKNEVPDVVIIEAVMPNLDAIELIKKLQASSYKKTAVYRYKRLRKFVYRTAGHGGRSCVFYAEAV